MKTQQSVNGINCFIKCLLSQNGLTPLHVAAHYDNQDVALLLLDKGATPHSTAKVGIFFFFLRRVLKTLVSFSFWEFPSSSTRLSLFMLRLQQCCYTKS